MSISGILRSFFIFCGKKHLQKNGSNIFKWEKTTKGKKHYEKDRKTFKTVEEASNAMAVYFENMD